jgi:hypothetical protein
LNTVKSFIVVLLSLSIIAIVTLIVLGSINTATVSQLGQVNTVSKTNETSYMSNYIDLSIASYPSASCTVGTITNYTTQTIITSGNYTVSNCRITLNTNGVTVNSTNWNITWSGTYRDISGVNAITSNVSTGLIGFFTNAGTYFSLLGVVVIILIISLVVVVVNRFGGEEGTSSYTSTM